MRLWQLYLKAAIVPTMRSGNYPLQGAKRPIQSPYKKGGGFEETKVPKRKESKVLKKLLK